MGSVASIAPTAEQQGVAWDTTFADWQPGPGDTLLRAYGDAVNKHLLERWLPRITGRILKTDLFDEAVGDGLVGFLFERAESVAGIDVAPSIVAAAGAAYPRLEAVVADVRALPYADGTFDAVVSTSTLDHFDTGAEIEQALRELHRVLRRGGSLIVTLDNASNPLVAIRNALPYGLLRRAGLVPYPTGTTCGLKELARMVGRAGLDVEDVDAIMHVPRLAVRSAGRAVAGDRVRAERLVSVLIRAELPRRLPWRTVSGQFVAVRATRPVDSVAGRHPRPARERVIPAPRAGGPRAFAMRVLGKTCYRRLEWLELRLREPLPEIEACVPLDVGFIGEAGTEEIAALHPGIGSSGIRARFARGDRCFGARHDGRLVSISWIATGVAPIDYLGLAVTLPAGTAYHYDRWTDPRLRGLRIAPATGSRLCRVLVGEGIDTMAAAVLTENRAAMRNALGFGVRPAGIVGWVGIGPVRRAFRRPSPGG